MPFYSYKCRHKGCVRTKPKDILHEMKFVGEENKLPADILAEITCTKHNILMSRVPQEPQLAGSSGGEFKTEKQLLNAKQKQKKLRSRLHFKNDVLNKVPMSPGEKRHFENKLKHLPKKDHEKMK